MLSVGAHSSNPLAHAAAAVDVTDRRIDTVPLHMPRHTPTDDKLQCRLSTFEHNAFTRGRSDHLSDILANQGNISVTPGCYLISNLPVFAATVGHLKCC